MGPISILHERKRKAFLLKVLPDAILFGQQYPYSISKPSYGSWTKLGIPGRARCLVQSLRSPPNAEIPYDSLKT